MRSVTVDRAVGNEVVVAEGLNGDETVVIDGQLRLSDGTKVSDHPARRWAWRARLKRSAEQRVAKQSKSGGATEVTR